jgi:hypothetical protein
MAALCERLLFLVAEAAHRGSDVYRRRGQVQVSLLSLSLSEFNGATGVVDAVFSSGFSEIRFLS